METFRLFHTHKGVSIVKKIRVMGSVCLSWNPSSYLLPGKPLAVSYSLICKIKYYYYALPRTAVR
jgi:hypothetical protein